MAEFIGEAILSSLAAVESAALFEVGLFLVENAAAINTVATLALAENGRKRASRAARAAYEASLRDRKLMVRSSVEPRRIVLGRQRVGGHLSYIASTGTNNDTLVLMLTVAGHEIDAFERYWLNDTEVTLDGSGYVQTAPWYRTERRSASDTMTITLGSGTKVLPNTPVGDVTVVLAADDIYQVTPSGSTVNVSGLGSWSGTATLQYQYDLGVSKARILTHLGTSGQTVDPVITALLPAEWDSNHRGQGVAYLACVFTYDQDAFVHGLPVVNTQIRGAKCYDPRTTTTAWTENPALLIRHYATSALGANLSTSQVDDTMVQAAANVCDTSVTYTIGATADTRALYTAGTVADTSTRPLDVILELAEAMAGRIGWANDKLRMRAGAYTAAVAALTEDHFSDAAGLQVSPRTARESLFNICNAQFNDRAQDYKTVDMPRVESSSDIAADGAELPIELQFGAITHSGQAQQVATVMLREARQALTVKARFKAAVYAVELFDVVSLTVDRYGWAAKEFLVVGRVWTLDGGIELTLREHQSTTYTFGGTYTARADDDNSLLPSPWTVGQVTGVAVTSSLASLGDGTNQTRTRVSWTALGNASVAASGRYEVQYAPAASALPSGEWSIWEESGNNTEAIIPGLKAENAYVFRVRARNGLGVRGAWSTQVAHVVTKPPNLAGVYVDSATDTSVTITNAQHVPDGETWRTSIIQITYTPDVDRDATVGYSARGTYDTAGSGTYASLLYGVYISGSFDGFESTEWYAGNVGPSWSGKFQMNGQRTFALTAGVAYTIKVLAAKYDSTDTVVVDAVEMQISAVQAP